MPVPAQYHHPAFDVPVFNPRELPPRFEPEPLAAELMHAALSIPTAPAVAATSELASMLHSCTVGALAHEHRLAFWLNLYNALVRYAFHCLQLRGSVVRNLRVFGRAAWIVGGQRFSLDIIEHGLLRGNARVPPWHLFRTLKAHDPRLAAATGKVDPRIHFALNCGASSCPPLQVYRASTLHVQLEEATRAYFAEHAKLDQRTAYLQLPRLMKYFSRDFGTRDSALRFAARYLDTVEAEWLQTHAARIKIGYAAYDWTIVAPTA
jgi:hypothetical protein